MMNTEAEFLFDKIVRENQTNYSGVISREVLRDVSFFNCDKVLERLVKSLRHAGVDCYGITYPVAHIVVCYGKRDLFYGDRQKRFADKPVIV